MGTNWTITGIDDTLYTVVTDTTTTYSAVIVGSVTDEILGSFYASGFEVVVVRPDLQSKTTGQGLYAITGYVSKSFPNLATTSYTVKFTLEVPGFRDYPLQVTIPVNATLPVTAPAAAMRRLPVHLQGRVVSDATGLPVAGTQVVAVDNPVPPPPPVPHTLLLRSPLYAAHASNAPVQAVTLTNVGSAQLTQPAKGGTATLQLNNTTGLTGPAFVQIKTPDGVLVEYALVSSVGPAPGLVTLATSLNRSYAAGAATVVTFVTEAPSGGAAHLQIDTNAGDGILVADTLVSASPVAVDYGNPGVEYHELGAVTDSNGYYGVDGVGRIQELFLQAAGTTMVPWMIEFDQAVNVVDFRI